MYVTECELIYHDMLSVSNLSKELSGQWHTNELAFHHEFTTSKTQPTKLKVQTIIIDIVKSDECLVPYPLHAVKN